jgi:hypothetical protein
MNQEPQNDQVRHAAMPCLAIGHSLLDILRLSRPFYASPLFCAMVMQVSKMFCSGPFVMVGEVTAGYRLP